VRSESSGLPRPGSLDIIFENENFLVLNKPENLPVHPGTNHTDNLTGRVAFHCLGAPFKPVPVHRLDKNTSGVILFAKSYSWLREIQKIWHSGQVEKIYLVWIKGKWDDESGPMTDRLLRCQDRVRVDKDGRQALSWVTPVLKKSGKSLLRVGLATGRNHQIRVQLAHRGFPVIGDSKYGSAGKGNDKMLLHSFILSWPGYRFIIPPDWPDEFSVPQDIIQAG
jgi:23S rRNA pseudouridine955/2504/2580 synthase